MAFPGRLPQVVAAGLLLPGLLLAESVARGRGLLRGCGWALVAVAAILAALLVGAGARMELRLPDRAALRRRQLARVRRARGASTSCSTRPAAARRVERGAAGRLVRAGRPGRDAGGGAVRAWLARTDPGWLENGEFEGLRWPLFLTVPFVLSGLAVARPLRRRAYNALLVLAFFFALQGLSVVAYVLRRLAGPPLFRAGLAALVLLNPWASQMLVLLGLFDQWADFRRWADPPAGENDE